MNLPPAALDKIALALELAVNRLLALDPDSNSRLLKLTGNLIEIDLTGTGLTFYLRAEQDGLTVQAQSEQPADARLCGTPGAFLAMRIADQPQSLLRSGAVAIEGDSDIARQFQQLLWKLDIDWEGVVAEVTGDMIAYNLGQTLRCGQRYLHQTSDDLLQNLSEYLRYERHWLPLRTEVDEWLTGVDRLRDDIARLEQRLTRSESSRNE